MSPVTFDAWLRWSGMYTMLPFVKSCHLGENDRVLSWEKVWDHVAAGAFVLESGKGGRYTYLGMEPVSTIRGDLQGAVVTDRRGAVENRNGLPLELVKQWMNPFRAPKVPGLPKFLGGCAGYWGYDVIRTIEKLPATAKADLPLPDYSFLMIDRLWVIDHEERMLYCVFHTLVNEEIPQEQLQILYEQAQRETERMVVIWQSITSAHQFNESVRDRAERLREDILHNQVNIDVESISGVYADFTKQQYMQAVHRIQEYIRQGDVFQVNLSLRQSKVLDSTPEHIYEWLRHLNPSPYMGFLKFPDFQLVCGSPELLVQLEDGTVRARPIAGTRPRGGNMEEDRHLKDELLDNEKERAEHIMLVDLERNDLGRISRYGSVRVDELMTVEYYSHVMHIVSEVTGQLAEGLDAFDVLAATFPGGTITGAPKIRTMEIIEQLEPVRRGPYTGSIGWIDYSGDMEFNIVIRTLLAVNGIGHVQAGAGIVIDSDAEREYTESLNKAKALWKAVQYASLASATTDKR